MQNYENTNKKLEEQIDEIKEIIKEIQANQAEELIMLQNNHTINMKKLGKLQEYNKISDMTNQIFEKRLLGIEQAINQLTKTLCS